MCSFFKAEVWRKGQQHLFVQLIKGPFWLCKYSCNFIKSCYQIFSSSSGLKTRLRYSDKEPACAVLTFLQFSSSLCVCLRIKSQDSDLHSGELRLVSDPTSSCDTSIGSVCTFHHLSWIWVPVGSAASTEKQSFPASLGGLWDENRENSKALSNSCCIQFDSGTGGLFNSPQTVEALSGVYSDKGDEFWFQMPEENWRI